MRFCTTPRTTKSPRKSLEILSFLKLCTCPGTVEFTILLAGTRTLPQVSPGYPLVGTEFTPNSLVFQSNDWREFDRPESQVVVAFFVIAAARLLDACYR
jgi:hypothetical protein